MEWVGGQNSALSSLIKAQIADPHQAWHIV
jgi:hypothetical protein